LASIVAEKAEIRKKNKEKGKKQRKNKKKE
jgi:hypothetical protein